MENHPQLKRSLKLSDLIFLNVAAIVSIRWLSTGAQSGPSSLFLWLLALLIFFIPLGLTVLELHTRVPGEGGLYLWAKEAFGDSHGFITGWSYWISNLVYFPSVLLFASGTFFFFGGEEWHWLGQNSITNILFCMIILWLVIALNIFGLEKAKWIPNVGSISLLILFLILLFSGIISLIQFGSENDFSFSSGNLLPDFSQFSTISFFATMTFAFVGFELAPIMGSEIQNPEKSLPKAVFISGILVVIFYLFGSSVLMIALPADQINLITGIPQAVQAIGDKINFSGIGKIAALFVILSTIAPFAAWMTGSARLPYVVGVDRYLPKSLGKIHSKFSTPYIALITQGVISSLLLFASVAGSSVQEAYWLLLDMTILITFVPFLYLFLSLPFLRMKNIGNENPGFRIPTGMTGIWFISGTGIAATLLSISLSMIPPQNSENSGLFFLKIIGGFLVIIAAGLFFFLRGKKSGVSKL